MGSGRRSAPLQLPGVPVAPRAPGGDRGGGSRGGASRGQPRAGHPAVADASPARRQGPRRGARRRRHRRHRRVPRGGGGDLRPARRGRPPASPKVPRRPRAPQVGARRQGAAGRDAAAWGGGRGRGPGHAPGRLPPGSRGGGLPARGSHSPVPGDRRARRGRGGGGGRGWPAPAGGGVATGGGGGGGRRAPGPGAGGASAALRRRRAPRGRRAAARGGPGPDAGGGGQTGRGVPGGDVRDPRRPNGHAGGGHLPARGRGVQPELPPAAPGHPVREAEAPAREADQDRLLDGRRHPGEASGGAPHRGGPPRLPGAGEAQVHLPGRPSAARRSGDRPHPHDLQPGRGGHRPALVGRPQPPEHPGPGRAGAPDPEGLHPRGAGPGPPGGRLLADRAAGARAPVRR